MCPQSNSFKLSNKIDQILNHFKLFFEHLIYFVLVIKKLLYKIIIYSENLLYQSQKIKCFTSHLRYCEHNKLIHISLRNKSSILFIMSEINMVIFFPLEQKECNICSNPNKCYGRISISSQIRIKVIKLIYIDV